MTTTMPCLHCDLTEAEHHAYECRRLNARIADLERQLESTKPVYDATDGAHPCWWRGHDNGSEGMAHAYAATWSKLVKADAQLLAITAERDRMRAALVRIRGDFGDVKDSAFIALSKVKATAAEALKEGT